MAGKKLPPDPLPPIWLGGTVNLLAGASGTGKTALIASWAAAMRDGLPINGYDPGPIAGVGVVSADRSFQQSTRRWFALAGFPDIPHYSIQDDLTFDLGQMLKKDVQHRVGLFERCLHQLALPPSSIVVAEPIADWLGGNILDYDGCSGACRLIRRLCQKLELTLIGIAHAAKQLADPKRRYQRLQDRLAGTTAILGYSDTQMYFASPEELGVDHYTLYWNPHHAPAETFALDRDPATGLFLPARKLAVGSAPKPGAPKPLPTEELVAWVSQAHGGRLFGEILDWAHRYIPDYNDRTLRRWLNDLVQDGQLARGPHKGIYQVAKADYTVQ